MALDLDSVALGLNLVALDLSFVAAHVVDKEVLGRPSLLLLPLPLPLR